MFQPTSATKRVNMFNSLKNKPFSKMKNSSLHLVFWHLSTISCTFSACILHKFICFCLLQYCQCISCYFQWILSFFFISVEICVLCQPPKGETPRGFTGFGGSLSAAVCQPAVQGNQHKHSTFLYQFELHIVSSDEVNVKCWEFSNSWHILRPRIGGWILSSWEHIRDPLS